MNLGICVEAVCCSAEDCIEAARAGAGRIELCSAIELGGLTPSLGLLRNAKERCPLPIMAMVRPRPGGFCYSEPEMETMLADLDALDKADGFVFGVLTPDRRIDVAQCLRLVEAAGRREKVFHRAFDRVMDPLIGLETLIDLGFTRILTSGLSMTAEHGIEKLKLLIENAAGRIEIMPGGGVRPENVERILATGCTSVHLAPLRDVEDPTASTKYRALDRASVEQVVAKCSSRVVA